MPDCTKKSIVLALLLALSLTSNLHAQCTVAVQAQVNLSLPSTCTFTVAPSMLLAPGFSCPGGVLVAERLQGAAWVPATVNATHIGQNLTVRVRDQVSGNFAVGNLLVQDKTGPVITNCSNITVNCEDACQPILAPLVSDCSSVTTSLTSTTTNLSCASTFTRQVTQIYSAVDAYNNASSCTRTISYVRRPLASVVYPANITLQVTGTNCAPWCNNGAGRPNPSSAATGAGHFGSPAIDGSSIFAGIKTPGTCTTPCVSDACQMNVSYTDAVVTLCGTNRRIDRTWQVSYACGGTQTYLQRIWIFTDGNTSCGAACGVPYNLIKTYSAVTGLTTFSWSVPAGTCVVRYDLQYRLKIGGVWQPWTLVSPGTNSYSVALPAGVPAEWKVRTRCNGVNSADSPTQSFTTGALTGNGADDRSDDTGGPSSDVSEVLETPALSVYPNPSQGLVTLNFRTPTVADAELTVTDLQGRVVYQSSLPEGTLGLDLQMDQEPAGVYFAVLRQPQEATTTARLVLIR